MTELFPFPKRKEEVENKTEIEPPASANNQQQKQNEQQKQKEIKKSPADLMIDLLSQYCSLFKSQYGAPYAKVTVGDSIIVMEISSQEFKDFIILKFKERYKRTASRTAIQETIDYMAAEARTNGPEEPVYLRTGMLNEIIYIDMANRENQAIEITPVGWRIIKNPPINFIRSSNTKPLCTPIPGGSLQSLRKFVKVASDNDFLMLISWMVFALHPEGPYPILFIRGQEGATKSNLIKLIHSIIDPSLSKNLSMPKNKHDVYISATDAMVVSYDNLTIIPDWFSNELCVISTGNDFSTRKYYTVDQQVLLHAKKPQIISGINNLVPPKLKDLLDRIVTVNLLPLSKQERQSEKILWREFEQIRGHLLGAICTAISTGLKNYNSIKPPYLERMADFAMFMIASEPALPCGEGDFMCAYDNNILKSKNIYLSEDYVGLAVLSFMKDKSEWKDTAENTIKALSQFVCDQNILLSAANWPQCGNKLRSFLNKVQPALLEEGIGIKFDILEKGKRYLKINNVLLTRLNEEDEQGEINTSDSAIESTSSQPSEQKSPNNSQDASILSKLDQCVDIEVLASYLEEKYQTPMENIEKVSVEGKNISISTTCSGEIKFEKKDLWTEEERLFEEAIANLSPEEQKIKRAILAMSKMI